MYIIVHDIPTQEIKPMLEKEVPKIYEQCQFSGSDKVIEKKDGSKTGKHTRIKYSAKSILSVYKEIELHKLLTEKYGRENILVQKISRQFNDTHKVTTTKKFEDFIKGAEKEMKQSPFYIKKSKNGTYWIGARNIRVTDLSKVMKNIYILGHGMNLVPNDFTENI